MRKYFTVISFIIISLIITVFLYFNTMTTKYNQIEQQMINKAYQEVSILNKIDGIHYFAGEKQYYVIEGKDHLGMHLFIWLNEKEANFEVLGSWVNKEEITKKALEVSSNIKIKRITPGLDSKGNLIYEVLFKDYEGRLGYQYFYYKTGEFIKMYKLSKIS